MRGPLLTLLGLDALMVAGCPLARTDQLEEDLDALEDRLESRRAHLEHLREVADRAAGPWVKRGAPQLPPGFDPDAEMPDGAASPDVLLVSIDTLRADHLGSYGAERDTSPFLDSLAERGVRFTDAWAPSPWTLPSHATMLSGLSPDRHGAIEDDLAIPPDVPLLAETFARDGYATMGVVSALFVSRRYGFDRGFDHFEDFGLTSKQASGRGEIDAEEVFGHALHWAHQQPAGTPLFAFVHLYDVHYTYDAPAPYDTRFDRAAEIGDAVYRNYRHYQQHPLPPDQLAHQIAQYDEEIAYVDAQLESLVERWTRSGRELVVVVTADHGEELGERGSWGHGHTLYPEQLHVPWIVAGPGIGSGVVDERVGLEDVAPTIAGVIGLSHPDPADPLDGVDRSRQLRDPTVRLGGEAASWAETSRFQTNRVRVHVDGRDLYLDLDPDAPSITSCDLRDDPRCARLQPPDPARLRSLDRTLERRLGSPWSIEADLDVRIRDGVVIRPGVAGRIASGTATLLPASLDAGSSLAIWPPDAEVRVQTDRIHGPFSILHDRLPDDDAPMRYSGPTPGSRPSVQLTDEEREMLRELGYIQE